MAKGYIAAVVLVFCAAICVAQEQNTLVVTVLDQTAAYIPTAHIRAIEMTTQQHFDASANGHGQAELHLSQGNYLIRVNAGGFLDTEIANFHPESQKELTITLKVSNLVECGPCVEPNFITPQDDFHSSSPAITAEIPVAPIQLLNLQAKRLHVRPHA